MLLANRILESDNNLSRFPSKQYQNVLTQLWLRMPDTINVHVNVFGKNRNSIISSTRTRQCEFYLRDGHCMQHIMIKLCSFISKSRDK